MHSTLGGLLQISACLPVIVHTTLPNLFRGARLDSGQQPTRAAGVMGQCTCGSGAIGNSRERAHHCISKDNRK
jgi:hypothetical protein